MSNLPKIIDFQSIGDESEGFLSVSNAKEITGFDVKRVFWTYSTPIAISRGRHAHYEAVMVLVAVNGSIKVATKCISGEIANFELSDRNQGLYIPKLCWHEMFYSVDAVQLVLCSTTYDESDYIRSKDEFEMMVKQNRNG